MINQYRLELVSEGRILTKKNVSIVSWFATAKTLLNDYGVECGYGWVNVFDSNGDLLYKINPE